MENSIAGFSMYLVHNTSVHSLPSGSRCFFAAATPESDAWRVLYLVHIKSYVLSNKEWESMTPKLVEFTPSYVLTSLERKALGRSRVPPDIKRILLGLRMATMRGDFKVKTNEEEDL